MPNPTPHGAAGPPQADPRWRPVQSTMRKHGFSPSALIETMHTLQETYGYLDRRLLPNVAEALHVPLSRVWAVATFYNHFSLKPRGEHTCVVCMGTACYIKGAQGILDKIQKQHALRKGETTPGGEVSLLTARCLGACGGAPMVSFDDEARSDVSADEATHRIDEWLKTSGQGG